MFQEISDAILPILQEIPEASIPEAPIPEASIYETSIPEASCNNTYKPSIMNC